MAKYRDYMDGYRKPVPRPGHVIRSKKDYNRNRTKEEEKEVIERGIQEYEEGEY